MRICLCGTTHNVNALACVRYPSSANPQTQNKAKLLKKRIRTDTPNPKPFTLNPEAKLQTLNPKP